MISKKKKLLAKKFISVLQEEAEFVFNISSNEIIIELSNFDYRSSLSIKDSKVYLVNNYKSFIEKDFIDGLVRMRLELMREIYPENFN